MSLDPPCRIRRLLLLHRLAFEAEVVGELVQADFFWADFHGLLPGVVEDPACRQALAGAAAGVEIPRVGALWSRLVDEVFVDAHLGFHNGRLAEDGTAPDVRAVLHLSYVERLLPWSGMTPAERDALEQEIARRRTGAHVAAGRWNEAAAACELVLGRDPENTEFQDRWVECLHCGALAGLDAKTGQSAAEANREAGALLKVIGKLEEFRRKHPASSAVYPALGNVYALHAVRLANAQRLPEALVSIEQALAFDPWQDGGEELMNRLFDLMEQLQENMRTLEADLQRTPGATLNEAGMAMRRQVQQGFRPLETFRDSGEAGRIQEARVLASAQRLWRDLSLPAPRANAEAHAMALLDAVTQVMRGPLTDAGELPEVWAAAAGDDPVLASMDPAPVIAFLRKRVFDAEAPVPPRAPVPAAGAGEAPRLASARRERQKWEPLGYWIFARRDYRVKLQAAAAVLLLVFGGTLWGRDMVHRERRDVAYQQVFAARDAGSDIGVVTAAEAFLANPLLADDVREELVREIYGEAIVRSALDGAYPESQVQMHLNRYRRWMNLDEETVQ